MSELALERGVEVTPKNMSFWVVLSLIALILFSLACIFLMLAIVPKFEQIFADALPGKILPALTVFIIAARNGIALTNLAWPILGTYLFRTKNASAFLWINLGIVWFVFEVGITVIAMFMPMDSMPVGMSEATR